MKTATTPKQPTAGTAQAVVSQSPVDYMTKAVTALGLRGLGDIAAVMTRDPAVEVSDENVSVAGHLKGAFAFVDACGGDERRCVFNTLEGAISYGYTVAGTLRGGAVVEDNGAIIIKAKSSAGDRTISIAPIA